MSRFEELILKLLNGEKIEDWECQSKIEEILIACINKTGVDGLSTPQSRAEELLQLLSLQMQNSGDGGTTPTGTLEIIENGVHNVLNYAEANVNVPIPDGYLIPEGTLEITENGSYNCDTYSNVEVTVPSNSESERSLKKLLDYTKSCYYMFYKNTNIIDLTGYIEYSDTSNVTTMLGMFYECTNLTNIPLLDTSNVTAINSMFYGCKSLTSVPQLDTSKVTVMNSMFDNCRSLTLIPKLDTSNVTIINNLFYQCTELITVSELNLISITSSSNCKSMFYNCYKLQNLKILNIKHSLQVGSGTSYGHNLTLESLIGLCQECINVGASRTLTVGSVNLEKLSSVYVKLTGAAEEDETLLKLPMVQCESTDEGAMLISEYMAEKGWTLA